jgi:DNA (cytosine-5)-methyltransferase 1
VDTTKTTTHVSLCAGYGGIDLGLRRAIPNLRTVAFSEIEAFASANLVAKMEAGLLDAAPIWTNLKTFPWSEFRDRVDILSGGYPCQPFSAAGKRLGKDDPRHLWPWIADGIVSMRPRVVFFENVEGHISLGLREVIEDLERLGYNSTWGVFSAREVGAPHQRKRVFILADRDGKRGQLSDWWKLTAESLSVSDGETRRAWPSRPGQAQHGWEPPRVVGNAEYDGSHQCSEEARGTKSGGEQGRVQKLEGGGTSMGDSSTDATDGCELANTSSQGCDWRPVQDRTGQWSVSQIPQPYRGKSSGIRNEFKRCGESDGDMGNAEGGMPKQSSAGDWREGAGGAGEGRQLGNTAGRLQNQTNASRKTRGWATNSKISNSNWDGQTESTLGGDSDGPSSGMDYAELFVTSDNRTDELRLLGNGVVPATATRAFLTLMDQLLKDKP